MGGAKAKSGAMDKKKNKEGTLVWRPVCTQDSSLKKGTLVWFWQWGLLLVRVIFYVACKVFYDNFTEPVIKDVNVGLESECQMQKSNDKVNEVTNAIVNSKALEDDNEDEAMKEKHSLSIQVNFNCLIYQ